MRGRGAVRDVMAGQGMHRVGVHTGCTMAEYSTQACEVLLEERCKLGRTEADFLCALDGHPAQSLG